MPIMLDDIDLSKTAPTSTVDPKFFSSKLTGSGKKIGLLNEFVMPVDNVSNSAYTRLPRIEVKSSSTYHDLTTTTVPLGTMIRSMFENTTMMPVPVPHVDDRFTLDVIGTRPTTQPWDDIFFNLTPQGLVIWEDKTGDKIKRDLVIQYRMELFFHKTSTPSTGYALTADAAHGPRNLDEAVFVAWSTSPVDDAAEFITQVLDNAALALANHDELVTWMSDFSVYESIAKLANLWASTSTNGHDSIAAHLCAYVDALPATPGVDALNNLAMQLRYLENYRVPLEAYKAIHAALLGKFDPDIVSRLSKQNLNLLMNHTLSHLEAIKPTLQTPATPAVMPTLSKTLSRQQLDAVTTHEPLVMTQAGAGSGKSTVIIERTTYLQACGVKPEDITVLSFTNAAADNISERNPALGSMTIARMIIDIYSLNHPGHQVSAIDTIINSIDIFYPNDTFAATLRARLLEVDQNKVGAFTALNSFVERHFDAVIALLDRIGQTSLELQIIICYQKIDTMNEPAHVQSRYLIIDEVQDNSVFEFIFVLKYITKHAQSLFIVGDASQTLYEFRSANPRALNTLESSGVFATFKLTTNYRSNQEILDFANVVLTGLETNQIAGIRLQANSLVVPTADSFQEKVKVHYDNPSRLTGFVTDDLPVLMKNVVIPDYVDDALARGEQVAFLAHSRREVATMQAVLEARYPNKHLANLVSERVYATDIFSKYIKNFWNDVLQTNPANASFVVTQGIQNNLHKLTKNAASPTVAKAITHTVSHWWTENSPTINAWVTLCGQNALTHADFYERLRDNLLDYEIRRNQEKLNVNKQRNQERKKKNLQAKADLVVSTIHGAKGLEFDNVFVLYKEDTQMPEEARRMYYVAFTRPMKSLYVLGYGTVKKPPLVSNYESIVAALTARDARTAALAAGIDMDLIDLDEGDEDPGDVGGTSDDRKVTAVR